ncbi:helix-turn-helix domain-containing protein [bacterium]|nr:helix-turn-helix domain-containing protein [bacterium]
MKRQNTPLVPQLLRAVEAARYLGVSRNFLQKLLEAGTLPCVRLDGYKLRIAKTDLDRWVRKQRGAYRKVASRNREIQKLHAYREE